MDIHNLKGWFQPRWRKVQRSRVSFWLLLTTLVAITMNAERLGRSQSKSQSLVTASEYVGSAACARCHQEIYKSYSATDMGRSMSPVTAEWLKGHPATASVEDPNSNLKFEVLAADGKLRQSEYQIGGDGQEIFRDTRDVE